MIVHDLYVRWTVAGPPETDSVPLIDPDAVLASPIASQRFESIPRRYPKIFQAFRRIELVQPTASDRPELRWAALPGRLRILTVEHVFRAGIPERAYHLSTIA